MLQSDTDMGAMMKQPSAPVKHEKAAGAGGSIIDMLERVESDSAKNLASEEVEEARHFGIESSRATARSS